MRTTILRNIRYFLMFAILVCIWLAWIFAVLVTNNLEKKKVIKITSPTSELHLDEYVNYNYVDALTYLVCSMSILYPIFIAVEIKYCKKMAKSNRILPSRYVMSRPFANIQPPPYSPPENTPPEVTQETPIEVTQETPIEPTYEEPVEATYEEPVEATYVEAIVPSNAIIIDFMSEDFMSEYNC
jgi:hypothetical protein